MACLDRFAYGLPDAQAEPAVAVCDGCGDQIYAGEVIYQLLDGDIYCCPECLAKTLAREMTIEEALGLEAE